MPETIIDIATRPTRSAVRSSEPPCVCATSLEQVESAWRLVYERYTQMGLIDENPFGIHTVPGAVGPHACVISGPDGPDVDCTMTLFRDNPMGLALDSVYARELDELRGKGRRLLEVGMLADRRRSAARSVAALFSMMRWALHCALQNDLTDLVIGVHPRHALFYTRYYGFEQFASPTSYPLVRNHPVVPLRLRIPEGLAQAEIPRGLAHAHKRPLPERAFSHRFAFAPEQLDGSQIAGFLKDRHGIDPSRNAGPERTGCGLAWSAQAL